MNQVTYLKQREGETIPELAKRIAEAHEDMRNAQPKIISRAEAKAKGLKYYFTGEICKRGGVSHRRVSDKACTCDNCRDVKRHWRKKNRESIAERNRRYYEENQEFIKEKSRNRRAENSGLYAMRSRVWQKENSEAARHNRRRWDESHREANANRARRYRKENRELVANMKHRWNEKIQKKSEPIRQNDAQLNARQFRNGSLNSMNLHSSRHTNWQNNACKKQA